MSTESTFRPIHSSDISTSVYHSLSVDTSNSITIDADRAALGSTPNVVPRLSLGFEDFDISSPSRLGSARHPAEDQFYSISQEAASFVTTPRQDSDCDPLNNIVIVECAFSPKRSNHRSAFKVISGK